MKLRELLDVLLGRFVPGAATVMALIAALIVIDDPQGFSAAGLRVAALELLTMTLGYAATTAGFRRGRASRLAGGLRHSAAGIAATITLGAASGLYQGVNLPGVAVLGFSAGAVTGLLFGVRTLFGPRPPQRTLDEREAAADAALKEAGLHVLPSGDVVPLRTPESQPERQAQVA